MYLIVFQAGHVCLSYLISFFFFASPQNQKIFKNIIS